MFSISTIASSTRTPGDQRQREQRQEVQIDPDHTHEPEGGDRGERDGHRGNDRGADVLKEQEDDQDGEDRALDQRENRAVILVGGVIDGVGDLDEVDLRIFLLDLAQLLPGRVVNGEVGMAARALMLKLTTGLPLSIASERCSDIAVADRAEVGQAHDAAAGNRNLGLRRARKRRARCRARGRSARSRRARRGRPRR